MNSNSNYNQCIKFKIIKILYGRNTFINLNPGFLIVFQISCRSQSNKKMFDFDSNIIKNYIFS